MTFSCYRRQLAFARRCDSRHFCRVSGDGRDEVMVFRVYGYVVMPEHVHLLISETEIDILATAIQALKIAVARRALHYQREYGATFWQKRYYDRNTRDYDEFVEKLRYIHRNHGKAWAGGRARGLEMEQLPALHHGRCSERSEIESQWTADRRNGKTVRLLATSKPVSFKTPHLLTTADVGHQRGTSLFPSDKLEVSTLRKFLSYAARTVEGLRSR